MSEITPGGSCAGRFVVPPRRRSAPRSTPRRSPRVKLVFDFSKAPGGVLAAGASLKVTYTTTNVPTTAAGDGRAPVDRTRHRRPRLELVRLLPDLCVGFAAGRTAGADQGRRHPDRRSAADHQDGHRTGRAVRADELRRRRRVHDRRRRRRPRRERGGHALQCERLHGRRRRHPDRGGLPGRRSTGPPARTASRPAPSRRRP